MKQKGEITVFLSLTLVILISLLFTVIEAARTYAVQFQTECAADMAFQSALAEYSRELLEQYELFFIDTGYGTDQTGYILLEEHLKGYLEDNLQLEETAASSAIRDLLQMSAESAVILQASGAADLEGEVLERKAVDYMLDLYGLLDLSSITSSVKETEDNGLLEDTLEKKREQNEKDIDAVDTTVEDDDGDKRTIPVNNPADKVNSRRGSSGILKLVTKGETLSEKEIGTDHFSGREHEDKDGFLLGETSVTTAEDLIFQKYLMEKCGKYTEKKEGSYLEYQMEYILSGKSADQDNLSAVVNKLLLLRETANFAYLMSDSGKQAEAEAMAAALSVVILFPELESLIKLSILLAWAYAESVYDIRTLLGGGKVPLWKSGESWRLSLENALKLQVEDEDGGFGSGLSYEEYLHILLALTDKEKRNERFMDIIEMDIRQTDGNAGFCIDHCIHAFTAELYTASAKGHSYMITRTAGYQK